MYECWRVCLLLAEVAHPIQFAFSVVVVVQQVQCGPCKRLYDLGHHPVQLLSRIHPATFLDSQRVQLLCLSVQHIHLNEIGRAALTKESTDLGSEHCDTRMIRTDVSLPLVVAQCCLNFPLPLTVLFRLFDLGTVLR
jgi:hypothetical protein